MVPGKPLARLRAVLTPRLLAVYAVAVAAGFALSHLHVPLAFMIGPMIVSLLASLTIGGLRVPMATRKGGQIVVAGSVALYFTPQTLTELVRLAPAMVGLALFTVAAAFTVAAVLRRLSGVDFVTAVLASVPLGPVESATLARGAGLRPGFIVFSQTLRLLGLILVVPPALILIDGQVGDPADALRNQPWTVAGALTLVGLAAIGAVLFQSVRLSNPYFLGPLAMGFAAATLGLPITAVPYPVLTGAQVLLGVWVGAIFDRAFFAQAGRLIPAAAVSNAAMIAICTGMGIVAAALTGERWTVMVLSAAPGSVTEMALAAKILGEGIAVVTAFHIARIFIVVPCAPLIVRIARRLDRGGRPPPA